MQLTEKPLIASKESEKVHNKFCPYAQNIKADENAIYFDSKQEAEMFDFTPCRCLKFWKDQTSVVQLQTQETDDSHLKEKFAILQHFGEYADPVKAINHFARV